ncbi:hypothetical protein [Aliikangiella sp. G2MR2-5]|uniref:hypothetical protein n=1 Tax=Aliikangiella sp. G2MR2-5 TaxID=2788943 RepID=UPI0018AC73DD|nr:hypothetical protein [Aliikangiella sp. G2MR2-5]
MKKASRFMPEYNAKKANKPALLVLSAVVLVVFIYQPVFLLIPLGVAVLVMLCVAIEQPGIEKYFQNLCEDRKGLSICDFSREFDPKVVDTWIIRAVYEQLQVALPTKQKVPIRASDSLFDTLKLDEDDIELDLVEEVAQRTGRSLSEYKNNPYYGKVTTVQNLVLFFNHQAR